MADEEDKLRRAAQKKKREEEQHKRNLQTARNRQRRVGKAGRAAGGEAGGAAGGLAGGVAGGAAGGAAGFVGGLAAAPFTAGASIVTGTTAGARMGSSLGTRAGYYGGRAVGRQVGKQGGKAVFRPAVARERRGLKKAQREREDLQRTLDEVAAERGGGGLGSFFFGATRRLTGFGISAVTFVPRRAVRFAVMTVVFSLLSALSLTILFSFLAAVLTIAIRHYAG